MNTSPNTDLKPPRPRIIGVLRKLALMTWCAPMSALGLIIAIPTLLLGGRIVRTGDAVPALLAQGAFSDWLLRNHPIGPIHAITLGQCIVAKRGPMPERLLRHELQHVRQSRRWGPLFPFLYLGSSAWQWLRGRDAYLDNVFEIDARNAEMFESE